MLHRRYAHTGIALRSARILLEASPNHLNLDNITEDLLAVRNNLFTRFYFMLTISGSYTAWSPSMTYTSGNSLKSENLPSYAIADLHSITLYVQGHYSVYACGSASWYDAQSVGKDRGTTPRVHECVRSQPSYSRSRSVHPHIRRRS